MNPCWGPAVVLNEFLKPVRSIIVHIVGCHGKQIGLVGSNMAKHIPPCLALEMPTHIYVYHTCLYIYVYCTCM
jgi:hypothetical protein